MMLEVLVKFTPVMPGSPMGMTTLAGTVGMGIACACLAAASRASMFAGVGAIPSSLNTVGVCARGSGARAGAADATSHDDQL